MFTNLLDLKFQRTAKQAVGFYIAYLLSIIILGGIMGTVYGLITGVSDFYTGALIGNIIAVIFTIAIASMLVSQKRVVNTKTIVFVMFSGVLALLLGGLIGLIPVAYLTMLADDSRPSFSA